MAKEITNYSKIKSLLLDDENIERVVIDDIQEKIFITPRQDINYYWIEDPLVNFRYKVSIKVFNKIFKVISYLKNKNKIYELVLKEYS